MDWYAIYDYVEGGWTWPQQMTPHQASSEILARKFHKPPNVPAPILARWRPYPVGWEYQPSFGAGYIALR